MLFNGILGMVTPPVALAAFAAATIAESDQWQTGWAATRLSWCAYFIPFMFAYSPVLVMHGDALRYRRAAGRDRLLGIFMGCIAVVGFFMAPVAWPFRLAYAGIAATAGAATDHARYAGLCERRRRRPRGRRHRLGVAPRPNLAGRTGGVLDRHRTSERTSMKRSTDRILTTHVGSLIRPPELLDFLRAQAEDGRPYDAAAVSPHACARVGRRSGAPSGARPASTSSATANSASRSAGRNMCSSGCPASSGGRCKPGAESRSRAAPTASASPILRRARRARRPSATAVRCRSASGRSPTPGRRSCSATSTTSRRRSRGAQVDGRLPAGRRAGERHSRPQERVLQERRRLLCAPSREAMRTEYQTIVDAGLLPADRRCARRGHLRPHGAAGELRRLPQLGRAAHRRAQPRARRHSRRSASAITSAGAAGPGPHTTDVPLKDIVDLILQGEGRRLSSSKAPIRATSTNGRCGRT